MGGTEAVPPILSWKGCSILRRFLTALLLCAGLLAPVFSQPVIDNLSFLGSLLIFCVGVNLAFGTKFKVANMLPALVFGVVFTLGIPYLPL